MRPRSERLAEAFGERYERESYEEEGFRMRSEDADFVPFTNTPREDEIFHEWTPTTNTPFDAVNTNIDIEDLMELVNPSPEHLAEMQPPSVVTTPPDPHTLPAQLPQRLVVRTRDHLLQVLTALDLHDPHQRRAFEVSETTFKLSKKEQYRLLPDLRALFHQKGLFLPRSTKKGPTFNYLVGVLAGIYEPIWVKPVPAHVRKIRKYRKSEVINQMKTAAAKPLGFGLLDSPQRTQLLEMLAMLKPDSFIVEEPRQLVAKLPTNQLKVVIPVSLSRFLRFNEARLEDIARQAGLAGAQEEARQRRAANKLIADLSKCVEIISVEAARARNLLNTHAILGIEVINDYFDNLAAIAALK